MALPTIGANLSAANPNRVLKKMFEKWGFRPHGIKTRPSKGQIIDGGPRQPCVFTKNGIPANNTPADAPSGVGDIIYDATNNDYYVCTVYNANNNFAVLKFLD